MGLHPDLWRNLPDRCKRRPKTLMRQVVRRVGEVSRAAVDERVLLGKGGCDRQVLRNCQPQAVESRPQIGARCRDADARAHARNSSHASESLSITSEATRPSP